MESRISSYDHQCLFLQIENRGTCLTLASQMDHKYISMGACCAKFSMEVGCSCFLSTFTLNRFDFYKLRIFTLDWQFALLNLLIKLLKISPFKVSRIFHEYVLYFRVNYLSRNWPNFFSIRIMERDLRRVEAGRLALLLEIHGNHVCRCDPEIQLLVVSSPQSATWGNSSRTLSTQFRIIFESH